MKLSKYLKRLERDIATSSVKSAFEIKHQLFKAIEKAKELEQNQKNQNK